MRNATTEVRIIPNVTLAYVVYFNWADGDTEPEAGMFFRARVIAWEVWAHRDVDTCDNTVWNVEPITFIGPFDNVRCVEEWLPDGKRSYTFCDCDFESFEEARRYAFTEWTEKREDAAARKAARAAQAAAVLP